MTKSLYQAMQSEESIQRGFHELEFQLLRDNFFCLFFPTTSKSKVERGQLERKGPNETEEAVWNIIKAN